MHGYFVRVGSVGQVGRFTAVEAYRFARGARVVCRTPRGLEVGQVLGPDAGGGQRSDGQLLRQVTVEDDLLLTRLERRKADALAACADLLAQRSLDAVLLDVEPTFDGQSIYFYFLGDVSPAVSALTQELADAYESQARLGAFADTLAAGCGPHCGTELAAGCGAGGCATCAVACRKPPA
jgi:cell fate regulator YaaT (PSP1 superfamily)